ADFGDVTGAPERSLGPAQTKLEDRRARTPRVQAGAYIQAPALIRRRLPVGKVATAADMAQLMLPVAQHAGVAAICAEQIEQRQGAQLPQPRLETMAEAAEVRVLAITQRQHGEFQVRQVHVLSRQSSFETRGIVRCLAFTVGTDDEQRAANALQRVQAVQGQDVAAQSGLTKLLGAALGQFAGLTALACIGD